MKTILKFTCTVLAILFFVSANAITPAERYFASPYAVHISKMKAHKAANGKKRKKMKHKKQSSKGPTCYAY